MSGSQGNYDIALSRADHDMWFPVSSTGIIVTPSVITKWDLEKTTWDMSTTIWDDFPEKPPIVKHTIFPINGADKVAQQIKITLLAFLGEWFLDVTFGVPYLEDILVKTPHMAAIETILRSHIADVPHVLRFESFTMDFDRTRRTLGVNFVVVTDYGPITNSYKLDVTAHV